MIKNPVLRGFCPDPSILCVNDDFYIATSTFEWWPGVRLWHSKDMKHWKQLPSPLRRPEQLSMEGNPCNCGVWAPCLSYCEGIFFLVFTNVKTQKRPYYNTHNYLVWTDNITGEWSKPLYLNSTGFDPSLFHDDDGKKYLINMRNGFKGILLQEYDHSVRKLTGHCTVIFSGTEAGYTEGPHLYKKNGFYYLLCAEGGTGYNHCETVARSESVAGPYELSPYNPLISSKDKPDFRLQKAGHASLAKTPDGETWMAYLCSRPVPGTQFSPLGRETALAKIDWTHDGWPVVRGGNTPANEIDESDSLPEVIAPIPNERDDFDTGTLPLYYSFPRRYPDTAVSLTERRGFLRLYGEESLTSLHTVSLAARRQEEFRQQAHTCLDFSPNCPEQAAGLVYIYNCENFYSLTVSSEDSGERYLSLLKMNKAALTGSELRGITEKISVRKTGSLFLKVRTDGKTAQFYYSYEAGNWQKAFDPVDALLLSDEACPGFTGAQFALYCHDMTGRRLYADFDYFEINTLKADEIR